MKKKITRLGTLVIRAYPSTLNILPQWISKLQIRKPKNHSKLSSSAERFTQNICACAKSQYNVQNRKYGRHNRCDTFKCCGSKNKPISTNIPYNGMMVKGSKTGNIKAPSPCRGNRMLRPLNHCQDITVYRYTELKLSLLLFDVFNMGNNDLSTTSEYDNHININFPLYHALNQDDLNTNLVDVGI